MLLTRNEMIEQLVVSVCDVTFTKKDGSKREMKCTLSNRIIPEDNRAKHTEGEVKKVNETVLAVYDLEADGWRSFRVESVTDFELDFVV